MIWKQKVAPYRMWIVLISLSVFLFFTLLSVASAAEGGFIPLEPLPGVSTTNDPGAFLNSIFRLGVIIAAFLAVGMIVFGGLQYMTTEAVSGKGEAKDRITSALSGLFLILLSSLLLSVINPDILNFSLFGRVQTFSTPPTQTTTNNPTTGSAKGTPMDPNATPSNFCFAAGRGAPGGPYRSQQECVTAANRALQNLNAANVVIDRKIELKKEEIAEIAKTPRTRTNPPQISSSIATINAEIKALEREKLQVFTPSCSQC